VWHGETAGQVGQEDEGALQNTHQDEIFVLMPL
jgi:hypothetical protein